ncbi:MAG: YggS family pyridoxal phosphate-dependent enzyme [Wenzhouxiangellaceae bacterium]|nr:YggS family pyridoxal phosphate-dependent enzyme [Wenzhouxiangellaceae bacterium]
MNSISALERLARLEQRIEQACRAAGRARESVRLLAVSKTRSAAEIRARLVLGLDAFGENYVDEALAKQQQLSDAAIEWHFIGPVQSNKTRALAMHFDWVQSVDRDKIVRRLAEQRPSERAPLNVLLQVNIDNEPQKAGCSPDRIEALAERVARRPELRLRGLMAIPDPGHDAAGLRRAFASLKQLQQRLAADHAGVDTLSMGMTDDLEAAIAEGSTMVRIGTALFGPRPAR